MHIDDQSRRPDSGRMPWTTLILLGLAQFMVILDITVVNVALPSIAEDLAFAEGDLQWVVTAYVLFTGGLLMLGGRATDLFGAAGSSSADWRRSSSRRSQAGWPRPRRPSSQRARFRAWARRCSHLARSRS
jgi:MFS family permease